MSKFYGNVVLITGASSGIGKASAEFLMGNGYKVYGTSRKQKIEGEEQSIHKSDTGNNSGFIKMLQLDVCNEDSIKAAVEYIVEKEGTIDILINNAGFGVAGAVEDTSAEEAYKQFDTNFFGVLRMCRNVVPIMRCQNRGLIINIGSVAGLITIPFQSMYCASKYALEAMSEALRIEVKPFGIKVVLVEPGDTKTGFTSGRLFTAASANGSAYRSRFEKSVNVMIRDEMNGPGPVGILKVINNILHGKNPPVRKIVGLQYKIFGLLKRLVPSRVVEYIITKLY